ncbi:MAG: ATP-binding protein, partial [Prochloron sp. SP5CPC1]|nr:ATP-binding protein [Candidatus Paraprochloron terpiosi SP5CPC1]
RVEQIKVPKTILTVTGKGKKKPPSKRQWRKVLGKIVKSGNDYYRDESLNWSMPFRVGPRTSTLGGLPQDEERFPIALWVRDLLREGIQILALNSIAMQQPCSPRLARTFKVDGSNLPLVVQDLQKNTQAFQEWVERIQTVLPDLETILVEERPEDKHLYLAIKYHSESGTVPSWQLDHGILPMLALTLLAYMDMPRGGIYLIQEPENDIHPKAIEAVFTALASVCDRQIFLRTRSSLFLDLAKRQQKL